MLIQDCFAIEGGALPESAAYTLYAALLEQVPAGCAAKIHGGQTAHVSQYLFGGKWYITLLGKPTAEALEPVLEELKGLDLRSRNCFVSLQHTGRRCITAEDLLQMPVQKRLRLELRTPTAFKSSGHYELLPAPRLLLQSAMLRWNSCFEDYLIEDEGEGLETMAAGLVYGKLRLESRSFPLKGNSIPGVCGTINTENRLPGFHARLADALLRFLSFSGAGIKTGLGMGGIGVIPAEDD